MFRRFILACKAFWAVWKGHSFVHNVTITDNKALIIRATGGSTISNVTFKHQD